MRWRHKRQAMPIKSICLLADIGGFAQEQVNSTCQQKPSAPVSSLTFAAISTMSRWSPIDDDRTLIGETYHGEAAASKVFVNVLKSDH